MKLKEISLLLKILEGSIELLGDQNYNLLLENENGYFKVAIQSNEKVIFCYQMNLSEEIGETFINWLRLKFIQEKQGVVYRRTGVTPTNTVDAHVVPVSGF